MNNLLNRQPILYEPVAKQQYDRLSKQAADARALGNLGVEKSLAEKRESFLSSRLKAAVNVLAWIWTTILDWIRASKPRVFKEA